MGAHSLPSGLKTPILAERRLEKEGMEKERMWEHKEMDAGQKGKGEMRNEKKNTVALKPAYLLHTGNPRHAIQSQVQAKLSLFPISHFSFLAYFSDYCCLALSLSFHLNLSYVRISTPDFLLADFILPGFSELFTLCPLPQLSILPIASRFWLGGRGRGVQFSPPKFIYPSMSDTDFGRLSGIGAGAIDSSE